VTIGGANVTLTNNNILKQTGTGRVIRDSVGYANLTVNNNAGALMQAADADVIQLTGKSSVSLNNYGSMISLNPSEGGSQAVDFNGVTGSNVVNNYGLLKATEADAVRPGMNGVVNNYGTIQSVTPKKGSSDAIDLQTNATGVQVFNYATGLIEGGRHGITGGPDADVAFTVAVTNAAGGIIRGINGSGINLDGFSGKQVLTLVNHGTITGQGVTGDGDGVDMDGIANITNTGIIRSIDAFAAKKPRPTAKASAWAVAPSSTPARLKGWSAPAIRWRSAAASRWPAMTSKRAGRHA
jgi:hypothetical protein